MTINERMDWLERRLGKDDELVVELRKAVTVTGQLEARQGKVRRGRSKWLEEFEAGRKEQEKDRKEHWERMNELDRRIAYLVSGFGEFIRQQRSDRP